MSAPAPPASAGTPAGLAGVDAFLATLNTLDRHPSLEVRALFSADRDVVVARAPGRLDVMGGIADYSGSLVLQLPLRVATFVALQRVDEPVIRVASLGAGPGERTLWVAAPVAELVALARHDTLDAARARLGGGDEGGWAAYVLGALVVLVHDRLLELVGGAHLLIASDVPAGAGVSSSAALEVAVMQAVAAAWSITLAPRELALLCQKVENDVVGAPCGAMDQMAVACGEANHLLALRCQPAELVGQLRVPAGIELWGVDSGVRHSVAGSSYADVRVGTFMGYRIIAELAGLGVGPPATDGSVVVEDPRWHGYLANLAPSDFEQHYAARLPEHTTGRDFLARYAGTTDRATRVSPDRNYAVRAPAAHAVHEHFRVRAFAALLAKVHSSPGALDLLGELMLQSHASYSACGLGHPATDLLVALARAAGPVRGVYGAKITGGGSGGTVALLTAPGGGDVVAEIAREYSRESGRAARVFDGSSPGAAAFGTILARTATSPPGAGGVH